MTTIGTASYHNPVNQHIGSDRSDASAAIGGYSEGLNNERKLGAPEASDSSGDTSPSTVSVSLQDRLVVLNLLDINRSKLKPFDPSTLPEDRYQDYLETEKTFMEMEKRALEIQHTSYSEPDLSNYAGTKPYATIKVAGQVVATIDNQGIVGTQSNALGSMLRDILIGDVNGTNGPDLAQARAEQIVKLLGGKITRAPTAITQTQFNLLPSMETKATVDYDAVVNDPAYAVLQKRYENYQSLEQKRAEYLAQQHK
jgi:hypothetical protein